MERADRKEGINMANKKDVPSAIELKRRWDSIPEWKKDKFLNQKETENEKKE